MAARNWAISIGINEYESKFLSSLKYAKQDAIKFLEFFKSDVKFNDNDILLFTEDSPDFKGEHTKPYRSRLISFFEKEFHHPFLNQNDSLWLFFSGHGVHHAGKDYLLLADSIPDLVEQTAIELDYISQKLNCSGAGYKFLIVDFCRIDGRKGQGFGDSKYEGITTIFSCKPYESSWEIGEPIFQGAFTHALLNIFKSQINAEYLTAEQIEKNLQRETIALNKKYKKPIQTPYIRCESSGRSNLSLFPPSLSYLESQNRLSGTERRIKPEKRTLGFRERSSELLVLKKDAFNAEAAGQLELAKNLWGQIFILYPSEQESYIRAIERIAERAASVDISQPFLTTSTKSQKEDNKSVVSISQHGKHDLCEFDENYRKLKYLAKHTFEFEFISLDISGKNLSRQKRNQSYLAESIGKIELSMLMIPGGMFEMGSQESKAVPSELPLHTVKVESFLTSRFPITKAQWREVAKLPQVNMKLPLRPCLLGGRNHPVVDVSWYEACEFCERLTRKTGRKYRLLAEAEWEYACRAGTTTPFHFGYSINHKIANYNSNYANSVDDFPFPNAFGLQDMHGNVWEWCQDHWHENYKGAPTESTTPWIADSNNENSNRVLRGGSWRNEPSLCRSACRFFDTASSRSNNIGFRIACSG